MIALSCGGVFGGVEGRLFTDGLGTPQSDH